MTETGAGTETKAVAEAWTDTKMEAAAGTGSKRARKPQFDGRRGGGRRAWISATSGNKQSLRLGPAILLEPSYL